MHKQCCVVVLCAEPKKHRIMWFLCLQCTHQFVRRRRRKKKHEKWELLIFRLVFFCIIVGMLDRADHLESVPLGHRRKLQRVDFVFYRFIILSPEAAIPAWVSFVYLCTSSGLHNVYVQLTNVSNLSLQYGIRWMSTASFV